MKKIDPFETEGWEDDGVDTLENVLGVVYALITKDFEDKIKNIKTIKRNDYLSLYYVVGKRRNIIIRFIDRENKILISKNKRIIDQVDNIYFDDIKADLYFIIKKILTDFFNGYEEEDVE